jgi:hypothetical protein
VKDDRLDDEVNGVVSIVICLESGPEVVVIMGEDCDSSIGERPLLA